MSAPRCTPWTPSPSRRGIEKTCGGRTARIRKGPHWWEISVAGGLTSASSLKRAKAKATRILLQGWARSGPL